MTNYFIDCATLDEGKTKYRSLLKEFHPDVYGKGGEAIIIEIIAQYEKFVQNVYRKTAGEFFDNSDYEEPADLTPFTEVLAKVMQFNCRVEIIGYWIYCFDSFEVKDQLSTLGFWFSGKHKAWIYSGGKKVYRSSKESLDEIRARKGSHSVRDKEDQKKIAS